MARTNNLTNFLTDVAGAIKEKKGSEVNIPAANFDTEIRNLPSQGTYEEKTISITQNGTQTVTPSQGYDAIDELTINANVQPSLQSKSYSFTQNTTTTLTPEQGYDGFSSIGLEINVPSGSEDIKLFDTVAHMQADPNPQEGDLAVVYKYEQTPWDGTASKSFAFPDTVVLSSAVVETISSNFSTPDFPMGYGRIYLTSTECTINFEDFDYTEITYSSSDGITYTRNENVNSYTSEFEWTANTLDTTASNFILTIQTDYQGLYRYTSNSYNIAPTQLTLANAGQLLENIQAYGKTGIITGDGTIINNLSDDDIWTNIYNISTARSDIPNSSNSDLYYTFNTSVNLYSNKLIGLTSDTTGTEYLYRYSKNDITRTLNQPWIRLQNKWYYLMSNTATNIQILEFDTTLGKTVNTYVVPNSYTMAISSTAITITEDYIVYAYVTGSVRNYTIHINAYNKSTEELNEVATINAYVNNCGIIGGIGNKVILVSTDSGGYTSNFRLINLSTGTVTVITNGGSISTPTGKHFIDNRYGYFYSVYKTGSSGNKGLLYDFANNTYAWTTKSISGWVNGTSGPCPCTSTTAILGLNDDCKSFVIYDVATQTIKNSADITDASITASYKYPYAVINNEMYYESASINITDFTVTNHMQYTGSNTAYSVIDSTNKLTLLHPHNGTGANAFSKSEIFKVISGPINLYSRPDAIMACTKSGSKAVVLDKLS